MKYILTHWVNGDYESRNLRPITRENKCYLISDVQRTADYDRPENKSYHFVYDWARKFKKNDSELGFTRSIGRRDNTDGIMHLSLIEPSKTYCIKSYQELFVENQIEPTLSSKIEKHAIFDWDAKIIKYLADLFKVDNVYNFTLGGYDGSYTDTDNQKRKQLEHVGTLFHINTFGGLDKKYIGFDDNYFNRTIMYWLFDDMLVFSYDSGKETW